MKNIFRIKSIIVLLVLFTCLSITSTTFAFLGLGGQHKKVKSENGEISIPIKKVNDGKAHYFSFNENGTDIHFFIVKSADGVIRAAFDACDVCYPAKKGYSQNGDFMVCNNCGRQFHSNRINVVQGGCNPAPLKRQTKGDLLVIQVSDILNGARYF